MRRKKKIIIGILCCALIFMGIGYAALLQTLTINATSKLSGKFNIIIDDLQPVKRGTSGAKNTAKDVPKTQEASYTSEFYKPGDYITYDVTVKNVGTIKGVLSDIKIINTVDTQLQSYLDSHNLKLDDIFETKLYKTATSEDLELGQVLDVNETYNFDIKTTLKNNIESMPEGTITTVIEVTYEQEGQHVETDTDTSGEIIQGVEEPDIEVNNAGLLTKINVEKYTNEDGCLELPPVASDGSQIKSIDYKSFIKYNAARVWDYDGIDEDAGVFIIYDEKNFDVIKEILMQNIRYSAYNPSFYKPGDIDLPEEAGLELFYINAETGSFKEQDSSPLKKIDLTQAIYLTTIKDDAFYNSQLSDIKFNESITTIGDYAFFGVQLSGTLELPKSIEYIGIGAFYGNQINELIIPKTTTTIKENAFGENQMLGTLDLAHLTNLTSLSGFERNQITKVILPPNVTTIDENAFYGNQINDLSLPEKVETIGKSAFEANKISQLSLPESVRTTGSYAFMDNEISTLIIKNGITTIGWASFSNNKISQLSLPESVVTIEDYAFNNNDIERLTLGNNTKTIGNDAFYQNKISELVIPSSVTKIGDGSFYNNPLTSINIKRTQQDFIENVTISSQWYSENPIINYES